MRYLILEVTVIKGYVLGPNPCYIEKLKGQYRWQIIFKSEKTIDPNGIKLHQYIKELFIVARKS